MKKIIILPLLLLTGCEGHYRYPCQDPENWGKLECNNDICRAEGECTTETLGRNPLASIETFQNDTETVPDEQNNISSECNKPTKSKDFERPKLIEKSDDVGNIGLEREVVEEVAEEQPLTMTTIVDTTAHNMAAQ